MENARDTYTQRARSLPKPLCQCTFQPDVRFLDSCAVGLRIQQPERRRRLLYVSQHPLEENFVLLLIHLQPRLRHQVAQGYWLRQLPGVPQQMLLNFPLQYFQRGVVHSQMMQQQHHQPTFLLFILGEIDAY